MSEEPGTYNPEGDYSACLAEIQRLRSVLQREAEEAESLAETLSGMDSTAVFPAGELRLMAARLRGSA